MTQATETPIAPAAPQKAVGIFTTQIHNQTIIMESFFSHNSTQTFGDKLRYTKAKNLDFKLVAIKRHGKES